jgi:hypothetical protein
VTDPETLPPAPPAIASVARPESKSKSTDEPFQVWMQPADSLPAHGSAPDPGYGDGFSLSLLDQLKYCLIGLFKHPKRYKMTVLLHLFKS